MVCCKLYLFCSISGPGVIKPGFCREMPAWDFTEQNILALYGITVFLGFFFPLLPKASRIARILPVDVIISVPAPFACSKSLEFPCCTDSPWLPGWEEMWVNGVCVLKAGWAGDKCHSSKDLWESHRSLWRGSRDGALVSFNSATGLKFAWVSKTENCQEPFLFFFYSPFIVLLWMDETSWGSLQTDSCATFPKQAALFYFLWFLWVAEGFAGSVRAGGERGAQCWLQDCPFSAWPGWDGEVSWKSRTGSSLLGCASGPSASGCNFGFCEHSNFTISWVLVPFIYACLLFIFIEVHADTELRRTKKFKPILAIFLEIFSQL